MANQVEFKEKNCHHLQESNLVFYFDLTGHNRSTEVQKIGIYNFLVLKINSRHWPTDPVQTSCETCFGS